MAQKTNLNVSPYYDDFSSEKNFYKVLYKPGFPVQARELTSSQSILQNQIQSFGDNIFKEGSVVIPGGISYDGQYQAVKLNAENYGVDISLYIKSFIGKKIIGQNSGVSAFVKFVSFQDGVNVDDLTIYVTYLSADNDSQLNPFSDGEPLICDENVTYGNTTINAGTPFASLISSDATAIGSAAFISKGVYFIRGYFVNVDDQTIILDNYTNTPSYRVGLKIDELVVTAKDDQSLYDNAKGFTNYAAPGADRLKINLSLTKKLLSDNNDTDFVELMRVDKGKIKILQTKTQYNIVRDWIAERTYDESGDYTVSPFGVSLHNSLNDGLGNGGLYFEDDKTEQRNTPSDDLLAVKVSAGKAYVRGYDVEKVGTTIIDVDKPREVGIKSEVSVNFEMGNILKVNTVEGLPKQGEYVRLFNKFGQAGDNIGSARAYSFNLEDAAYTGNSTVWELRLFDIQTNTSLTLNDAVSSTEIPAGSLIEGKSSGANGYTVAAGSNSEYIDVNQTSGSFSKGEQIQVNGIDFSRTIGIITSYNTQNIKSVSATNSLYPDFKANSHLESFRLPNGIMNVAIDGTGTVTAGSQPFTGLRKGSVVIYNFHMSGDPYYNTVKSIGAGGTSIVVEAISPEVPGVFKGTLASNVTLEMKVGAPIIVGSGRLYSPLENINVSTVNLDGSQLKVTKQLTGQEIAGAASTVPIADVTAQYSEITNATFEPFDQERYSVHYQGGGIGTIRNDTFAYGSSNLVFTGLGEGSGSQNVISVSINKKGTKSKVKEYNRSKTLDVIYSNNPLSGSVAVGNGAQQLADGLEYDKRYGLRVQDKEISLNYPDVVKFLAVYESIDTSAPSFDVLKFPSTIDVQTNSIIGEDIVGENSKVIARIVTKPAADKLGIVYLTPDHFSSGEPVKFTESNITTNVESIELGNYKDITNSFTINKGQRHQYYDYSRLVRNDGVSAPSGRLLIVFDYYSVPSDDNGDVFTALSYDKERFNNDIPLISNQIRATDVIDFRPRVSVYNPAVDDKSPFAFQSRNFSGGIKQYLIPNESSTIGYEYYLPRIDKLYLNKFGDFVYEKGLSAENPKPPARNDELMQLATINMPPYLYNPQNAFLTLVDNRRYTMKDIGGIDDRVSNLEETTTLSLLESSAQSLQIQDSEGRNRFKTGLFVDPFSNYANINRFLSSVQVNPRRREITARRTRDSLSLLPTPKASTIPSSIDFNTNYELFDSNVQKTGNVITLKYDEVDWITQAYATKTGDVLDILNVNPYELPAISADVHLDPDSDNWTRTIQLEDNTIQQTGTNSVDTLNLNMSQSGTLDLGNILFNTTSESTVEDPPWHSPNNQRVNTSETGDTFGGSLTLAGSSSDSVVTSNTDTTIQNRLLSSASEDFMRSRNIEYVSTGFPEHTNIYLFVDGQQIFDIIPKLVEISPNPELDVDGSVNTFVIGEKVTAYDSEGNIIMTFRICRPDHKEGAFNNPSSLYASNPYSHGSDGIGTDYTTSSPFLNVDTRALSEQAQGLYSGYLTKGCRLVGENGASAYVKDLRLVSDSFGSIVGSFFLRNPNSIPAPAVKINTGAKTVTLTTSQTNRKVLPGQDPDVIVGETNYTAIGTVEEWQNDITVTTNTSTLNVNAGFNATINAEGSMTWRNTHTTNAVYTDPLAQTFVVGGNVNAPSAVGANDDMNGAIITAVDVFFASIDTVTETPVRCEIRTTTGDARPSMTVLGSKILYPTKIDSNGQVVNNIEFDPDSASKPTKFVFPEPIYLAPGASYAVVLLAEKSTAYTVWTARHGGTAVNPASIPGSTGGASITYSRQYGAGALFKSQNGALWTEDQTMDMTFKLYKAKFTSTGGSAFFSNPDLDGSNGYIPTLRNNPIQTLPKTGSVGITTIPTSNTVLTTVLSEGRKICGNKPTSTAVISGVGCSVTGLSVVPDSGGSNYKPNVTNTNTVDAFTITGQGKDLKFNYTSDENGTITAVQIVDANRGTGYKVGDVVGIVTSTVDGSTGDGARITIQSIGGIDTLYLTNIQGTDTSYTGVGVSYFNNSGNLVGLANTTILETNFNNTGINAGNTFKVTQFNHGMYSSTNKVSIQNLQTDSPSSILDVSLTQSEGSGSGGTIGVANTTPFDLFEGVKVSAANTGYVTVGGEIIGYSGVGNGILQIANSNGNKRGVDGTNAISHEIGDVIRKYELGGVSLRRLQLEPNSILNDNFDLDSYYLSFDRSKNGLDRSSDDVDIPQLSFTSDSFVGGNKASATQNILYSAVVPRFDALTPTGIGGATTGINASIRTVTGTSVSGTENSFVDNGYEPVALNRFNKLNSVRIVASKTNENEYLSEIPRNKSFTAVLNLTSNDENLSPMIRLGSGSSVEFIGHRLNNPIGDNYVRNSGANSILNDPHTAVYVSSPVRLTKPATSLKVLLTGYRHSSSDFRVLYALETSDSSEIGQAFELFPGYRNLIDNNDDGFGDVVIDPAFNDGKSDSFVSASTRDQYKEYQYTADNLPEFTGYTIKIVMSGTNQAEPPRIRELRTIAVR